MPDNFSSDENESQPVVAEGFRCNVALILEREDGNIFIGERIDRHGAWQFPQGGVDDGESLAEALHREVEEEIGILPQAYQLIERRGGYRYLFPQWHRRNGHYKGQEQTYFRCRFIGNDSDIDLDTAKPEFSSYQWIAPEDFDLSWLPSFKSEVYMRVLSDFFGVSLESS
ncbi:MAG: NUDIX domain-containing protein [Verrucomicrobiaceae bacterium]|nr:NUDIX domain-containing protein [Verrucomicrobiaceae bacterium]